MAPVTAFTIVKRQKSYSNATPIYKNRDTSYYKSNSQNFASKRLSPLPSTPHHPQTENVYLRRNPASSFLFIIHHSSFITHHSSFLIPHSTFNIQHSLSPPLARRSRRRKLSSLSLLSLRKKKPQSLTFNQATPQGRRYYYIQ